MNTHNASIYVVAARQRPAIVLEALKGLVHNVCWTTDYKLPKDWKPEQRFAGLVQNQVGAYRCYRGHLDAMRFFRDQTPTVDAALIFEDDAWPNTGAWTTIAAMALPLLDEFEVVSLHGRAFDKSAFDSRLLEASDVTGRNVLVPKTQGQVWVQGALAYLIRRDAVDRIIDRPYDGNPLDILICNDFKYALIDPSPFDHNRVAGSLIDCPVPADGWET
jgi:hypothetical protein